MATGDVAGGDAPATSPAPTAPRTTDPVSGSSLAPGTDTAPATETVCAAGGQGVTAVLERP
ncbi:hypothetical protein [Streptomyces sp. NPDC047108]|uniref:hypothetical protein n=1 Tax=Streptomyces sp. NPDC047108 TaxID=3155025 RepID=UPI0033D3979C